MNEASNTGSRAEAHVNELLSGYLDDELTQQKWQLVSLHLETCSACSENLEGLRALRERMGQAQLGDTNKDIWREKMDDTAVKLSRGTGWFLLIGGLLAIAGIAIVMFLTSSSISGVEKLLISAVYLGLGALFVSVLRQRLIERKTDKYKDVEI
jgi:anti-sigma factor RsiW